MAIMCAQVAVEELFEGDFGATPEFAGTVKLSVRGLCLGAYRGAIL